MSIHPKESHRRDGWYEIAHDQTVASLSGFVEQILSNQCAHDGEDTVHAIVASAVGAANAAKIIAERKIGLTKAQLRAVVAEFGRRWAPGHPWTHDEGWANHPLCGPRETMPVTFWGQEPLRVAGWDQIVSRMRPEGEIAALQGALEGVGSSVLIVGGREDSLTREVLRRYGGGAVVLESDLDRLDILSHEVPPGVEVHLGCATHLPFEDDRFMGVMAAWALQHSEDPWQAVRELARVARKASGARIVLVQAAPGNHLVKAFNACAKCLGKARSHHGWLLAGAAEILEREGFSGISLERVSIPLVFDELAGAAREDEALRSLAGLHPVCNGCGTGCLMDRLVRMGVRGKGILRADGVVLVARYMPFRQMF